MFLFSKYLENDGHCQRKNKEIPRSNGTCCISVIPPISQTPASHTWMINILSPPMFPTCTLGWRVLYPLSSTSMISFPVSKICRREIKHWLARSRSSKSNTGWHARDLRNQTLVGTLEIFEITPRVQQRVEWTLLKMSSAGESVKHFVLKKQNISIENKFISNFKYLHQQPQTLSNHWYLFSLQVFYKLSQKIKPSICATSRFSYCCSNKRISVKNVQS